MCQSIEIEIKACEDRLQQAMLESDVRLLDELISPDLIFTNHLGQLMTKQDDLEEHQSGMLNINKIIISDQNIKILNDIVIVTVQTNITGEFSGKKSTSNFRFTRIWNKSLDNKWQIIAGHSSIII